VDENLHVLRALGQRIRELRELSGRSQAQFAEDCGLALSLVAEIERGARDLSLDTMVILAQQLQTTVSALFKDIAS
jgi:transcriptional regulator with XRE-family HTH domain